MAGHGSGTSAAAPAFAGIISMLNDARLSKGKPSLGFLNPLLYSKLSGAFNDVTSGSNPGCGTTGFNVCALLQLLIIDTDRLFFH